MSITISQMINHLSRQAAYQPAFGHPRLLTPPVGLVLFVLQKVAKLSFEATVRAVMPWMIPLLATLVLITYVPSLVLWLPGLLYK